MNTHEGTINLPFISGWNKRSPSPARIRMHKPRHGGQEKAICLDDDPLSLRLVEHLLKERYEVISCANIDAAIRAVKMDNTFLLRLAGEIENSMSHEEPLTIAGKDAAEATVDTLLIKDFGTIRST